jgi:hypothetical protein
MLQVILVLGALAILGAYAANLLALQHVHNRKRICPSVVALGFSNLYYAPHVYVEGDHYLPGPRRGDGSDP